MTLPPPQDDAVRAPGRPAPPGPPDPAGHPEPLVGAGSGSAEGHLDDLVAMRLADGQAVDPPQARHIAGCGLCAAVVAAFKDESLFLTSTLALDDTERHFLATAGVPSQVVAAAARARFPELQRDTPAALLAVLLTALAGYGGWLLVQPLLATGLEVAQRSGAVAVAYRLFADWLIGLLITSWGFFSAAQTVRLLQNPTLPLALLALLAWLAIWLVPHLSLPSARPAAAA